MQNDMSEQRLMEIVFNKTQWFCVDVSRFELRIELLGAANAWWRIMNLIDIFQTMDLTEMMKTMDLTEMMNL